ncbi:hypothetical protein F1188_17780 [Roseospira marina]|uniref:Methyltransferase n=1 Tax=Roseospira marina TaxID=140057 RepID=A0A5M6I7F5_9PROT|nr:hypothetical protein [Roseospira marina]KAA5604042.1 hypothetical protein F1188_17780 [Roseospira marina]MBB4315836.1 hypothetical protein [Roseospira marina]MBB5089024.1 hypothetical protein [Roseospira marina]
MTAAPHPTLWPHLASAMLAGSHASLTAQAVAAECYETPDWAARRVLEVEILTRRVLDPCCGTGILSRAARAAGYDVGSLDLHRWGYPDQHGQADFLADPPAWIAWPMFRETPAYLRHNMPLPLSGVSVFMNPPFSQATGFVDRAFALGARKVLCFQRLAWRESQTRRAWWDARPPARIWLCGDRALCWRFDIPPEARTGGSPTAHAWFVWEQGHRGLEAVATIWKDGRERVPEPPDHTPGDLP